MLKAAFSISENLKIDAIECPIKHKLHWGFIDMAGSDVIMFTTEDASFKISDRLAVNKIYKMVLTIKDEDDILSLGTCNSVIEIVSASSTLNTQIRETTTGNLQGALQLQVLSFDADKNLVNAPITETILVQEGGTTNLLETEFKDSFKIQQKVNIRFKPGIWKDGVVYVLKVTVQKDDMIGKAVKIIRSKKPNLFEARVSPVAVKTGDKVKIAIQNKSQSMCLSCVVGLQIKEKFHPYSVLNNPEKL